MENNIRFRNHISIILENSGRAIWTLVFVFIGSFIGDLDEMGENGESILSGVGILLAVIAVFVLIAILWQIFVWSKTYISVQDNTIVIERNTLNRKKNAIGIKNISNVNLEQNLFEMAIGTCKVKLDTNSLSTADTTDVKIIIKKEEAKAFQAMIVEKLRATTEKGKTGYSGSEGVQEPISQMQQKSRESKEFYVMQDSKITASVKEILQHGLFSTNILSVVILIGVIAGIVGVIGEVLAEGMTGDIVSMVLSMMIAVWFIAGLIWSVLKGYIKYMDFEIQRQGDKVLLSYGILKKVTYSIPVDKINAIKCSQSIQARIAGRYMVEIVNVGMGDDESEKSSFFLPYDKADHCNGSSVPYSEEIGEILIERGVLYMKRGNM